MNIAPEASTRDKVIEVALELFAAHGYAGASMRQLATAVGVRASSLYNHFESKEALLSALIDTYGPARGASRLASRQYRSLEDDPEAFCRLYAADWLDQWCDPNERRFMDLLGSEPTRMRPHRSHFVETLFEREVAAMTDYFRRFALMGRIWAPDPKECARLFMAGLTFVRMQHVLMPPEPSPREVIAEALERAVGNFLLLIAPRS